KVDETYLLYLRGVVDRMSTKMESLTETVLQLSTSVTSLQRQPAPVSAEPRIGLPDKWNGVDGRPDGLLATLDMLFECQPTKYATAHAKVALLTSLLSGQAQEWAAALYNNKFAACNDYALFVDELKKTFVPPSSEDSQSEEASPPEPIDLDKIPPAYHDLSEVFSKR
uniref:DUF4939 domain-containing protein n=1 Tax=Pundamilia nyererei TaxID=303518 RepID=A0A3B4H7I8_9CICH